jgi:hypothetical protein|tara:strand:- start:273 stop:512 length:240 start_codon:yes stop_codon:yes gene_type:complete
MKAKEIRNGCLYYNTLTKRVERAIGKVGRRVMTMVHDQDTKLVKSDNFRRASQLQVDNYLNKKSKLRAVLKRVATLKLF